MTIEEEMVNEIRRLESEIDTIDMEMEKLHNKMLHLIGLRKKKEHDLHILRMNDFGEGEAQEFQTSLSRLLREKV